MKGCSMSTVEWECFDLKNNFSVFDAACLWLEIEPTKAIEKDMPGTVRTMIELIEEHTEGTHNLKLGDVFGPKPVSRASLIKMAETVGKKPKFLFKELRNEKPEKSLSTKERNTALKLIIGMAMSKYGYKPSTRTGASGKIVHDLQLKGIKMDDGTVNSWLKEASEKLDDFSE